MHEHLSRKHQERKHSRLSSSLQSQQSLPPTKFHHLSQLRLDDEDDSLSLSSQELDAISTPSDPVSITDVIKRLDQIESLLKDGPPLRNGKCSQSRPAANSADWEPQFISGPPRKSHRLDEIIERALDYATADRSRGRNSTGVRAWFAFCQDVMHVCPERAIDPNSPLVTRLEEEWLAMRFVCALVEERGVLPETAAKYLSQVQGWHAREFGVKLAGGLKMERLPQMVKGLRRANPREPKPIRRGIAPKQLGEAFKRCLNPADPLHANVRAASSVALQGLLRSAEYCGKRSSETLLRGDIKTLTDDQLVIMMHPCKSMRHISGKTCPLVLGAGGKYVDAVAEVRNLLRVDPAPDDAPLFRMPDSGEPISYDFMLTTTRQLLRSIGLNPAEFGTHSFRIGGATALFAAGANDTIIRTMGRWSSDIFRLYVRACYEQCVNWSRHAGSADVSSISADFDEVDDY